MGIRNDERGPRPRSDSTPVRQREIPGPSRATSSRRAGRFIVISAWGLALLAALAAGMATTTAVTIKWTVLATGPLGASTVEFVLAMMSGMFVGVLVYFAEGGTSGLVTGFWVAAVIMSASVFLVFIGFFREARLRANDGVGRSHRTAFLASVIVLVVANEFLMGWSFSLISGFLPTTLGPDGHRLFLVLTGAVTSAWFVFPMALEMVLSLAFFLDRFPAGMRRFLLVQPAIMVCSPPTIPGLPWLLGSTIAASGLMAVAVAWLLIALFRNEELAAPVTQYLLFLYASFGLMAAGLYVWIEFANAGLFAIALIAQMLVFLGAVTAPDRFGHGAEVRADPAPVGGRPERGRG